MADLVIGQARLTSDELVFQGEPAAFSFHESQSFSTWNLR